MVLGYHRVDNAPDARPEGVLPATFAMQIAHLAAHRAELPVLDLDDGIEKLATGGPHRAVTLTFDDAWADNHTYALGPLVEHKLPATLYAPSGLLGTTGYVTKSQLIEMAGAGMTIGAHSRTHVDLRECSAAELEAEVRGSRDDLEDLIGREVTSFAYPTGWQSPLDGVGPAPTTTHTPSLATSSKSSTWRRSTPPRAAGSTSLASSTRRSSSSAADRCGCSRSSQSSSPVVPNASSCNSPLTRSAPATKRLSRRPGAHGSSGCWRSAAATTPSGWQAAPRSAR
jgi:peptidoglycan/xylan/chitin deacetylase (PgdA/CDA1 family)